MWDTRIYGPRILRQIGYGLVVEFWGLDMVFYKILRGLPPWYTTDRAKLFKRIKRAPLVIPSYFTMEAQDLISWLLERDPYSMLGAVGGVQGVMQHGFFHTFKVAGGHGHNEHHNLEIFWQSL